MSAVAGSALLSACTTPTVTSRQIPSVVNSPTAVALRASAREQQRTAQELYEIREAEVKIAKANHEALNTEATRIALQNAEAQLLSAEGQLTAAQNAFSAAGNALQNEIVPSSDPYGLTYFLPRQLASVTARRTPSALSAAIGAVTRAQGKVDAAVATLATRDAAVIAARAAVVSSPNNATSRRILLQALTAAEADQRLARTALDTERLGFDNETKKLQAEAAKPRTANTADYDVVLSISLQPPTPDPAYGFRLTPEHSNWRDDEHKFTIGANGLLSTANTVSVDRTTDVLVELATLAGAMTGAPIGGVPMSGNGDRERLDCTRAPDEFSGIVDLASAQDVLRLNTQIQCMGLRLSVAGAVWAGSQLPPSSGQNQEPLEGIAFRQPVQRVVTIEKCTALEGQCTPNFGWFATEELPFMLPQAGPVSVLRQDADPLTRTSYDIAFDNGIPTSFESSRPSTYLAGASAPLRLLNAVADGASTYLSRLASVQIGQANNRQNISAAELAALNQEALYALAVANNQHQAAITNLGNQQALALAGVNNQQALLAAEQQLANTQAQFAAAQVAAQQAMALAGITNQQALAIAGINSQQATGAAQMQLLNTQTQSAVAQLAAPGQVMSAQTAAMVAQLQQQNLRAQLERCISQIIASAGPGSAPDIAPCLVGL